MLALLLSDKLCCFGIFVFNRFLFSRFSFHHFFVLVFVNEFVIFSFFTIFVFVNENHCEHHRHPLGYLCAKFRFFHDLYWRASPLRKIEYSITQSLTYPAYWCPRNRKWIFDIHYMDGYCCLMHCTFRCLCICKVLWMYLFRLHPMLSSCYRDLGLDGGCLVNISADKG